MNKNLAKRDKDMYRITLKAPKRYRNQLMKTRNVIVLGIFRIVMTIVWDESQYYCIKKTIVSHCGRDLKQFEINVLGTQIQCSEYIIFVNDDVSLVL